MASTDGQQEPAETPTSLEMALQRAEANAEASVKAAAGVTKSLKRFRSVIRDGNLREVRSALATVEQTLDSLRQQVEAARESWKFDDAEYLASGAYTRELLETAERLKVLVFEQDDRLYCYPSLVRVLPSERTVLIDRARERRLRPSRLIQHLRELQGRPQRFKPEAFLESLYGAFRWLVQRYGADSLDQGRVERLSQVYELLTLLPGQSREYSRQEFARDIYLLDRSGLTETRDHFLVSFPASTGTKASGGVFSAVTEFGQARSYWGISFVRAS